MLNLTDRMTTFNHIDLYVLVLFILIKFWRHLFALNFEVEIVR